VQHLVPELVEQLVRALEPAHSQRVALDAALEHRRSALYKLNSALERLYDPWADHLRRVDDRLGMSACRGHLRVFLVGSHDLDRLLDWRNWPVGGLWLLLVGLDGAVLLCLLRFRDFGGVDGAEAKWGGLFGTVNWAGVDLERLVGLRWWRLVGRTVN